MNAGSESSAIRVDAMVVGAMKCGTSSLAALLKDHPEVAFCRRKEPEFFSKHPDPLSSLEEYHNLFEGVPGRLRMEASTGYTFYPHFRRGVWHDLHEYNPELRFIYLVRDPVDRIVSHYMHIYERGFVDKSLEEAVRTVPLLVNNTRYHMQVLPFVERFGRDQVLILTFENLVQETEPTLHRVAEFLGIDPAGFPTQMKHSNPSLGGRKPLHRFDSPPRWARLIRRLTPAPFREAAWRRLVYDPRRRFETKPELSSEWCEAVIRLLETDIGALEQLLECDLSAWLARGGRGSAQRG